MSNLIFKALRLVGFCIAIYYWLSYAISSLDRSPEALASTGGGPLPSKFSFLILSLIIFVFFARSITKLEKSFGSICAKIIFALSLLYGLVVYSAAFH